MERNFNRSDKRAKFIKKSKETVMEALRSRDMVLGGVTKTIVDLDETINLLSERLEYWYGVYFPELKLDDKIKFAAAVVVIDRTNIDEKELAQVVGPSRCSMIIESSKKSLGADLSPSDMAAIKELANSILHLGKLRADFDKYQKEIANELCPNMATVAGSEIAALLVSHVGSLKRLAVLPSSTIQVLGAEKALFKHLKNRKVPPPKHGIIFQHPKISSSPKAVRGKIARALANKLCLAAKADGFTKNTLGPKLKADFEARVEQIMKEYEVAMAKGKISKEMQSTSNDDSPSYPDERREFRSDRGRDRDNYRRNDDSRDRGSRDNDRFDRGSRDSRPRNDRFDRGSREERNDRFERSPRPERSDRFERSPRSDRSESDRPRSDDRPRYGERRPSGFERSERRDSNDRGERRSEGNGFRDRRPDERRRSWGKRR